MKKVWRPMIALMIVGLAASPVLAAELRVTGNIENIFPHWERNISGTGADNDVTHNHDQAMWGRTRANFYFNFIASDNLRGVFGLELDGVYGTPRRDAAGSGCYGVPDDGLYENANCGFGKNTDVNNFETKWLYVDFSVPQIPVGNRTQVGAFHLEATPLHSQVILRGDFGGGATRVNFSDQAALLMYYVQLEEDVETYRFANAGTRLGEDYATGATLLLKPLEGLDLHLVGIYGHLQNPFSSLLTGNSGPFGAIQNMTVNVTTESRYYTGFDSRYRIGNLSLEPFFVYLFGSRNFCGAGTQIESTGLGLIPCTSPVGSRKSTDYNAFVGNFGINYTTGPWLLQGKYTYVSGNKATDDINNRGIGNRNDVRVYQSITSDGSPIWNEWFEILGRSEIDGTSLTSYRRQFENGHFDRFGYQVVAVAPEYQWSDNLTLEGAVGAFWSARNTACPAVLRTGSIDGPCTQRNITGGSLNTPYGQPIYNYTGGSTFIGWEIDVGHRYSIMPGLTWLARFGYAEQMDAMAANNRKAQPAFSFSNRLSYVF